MGNQWAGNGPGKETDETLDTNDVDRLNLLTETVIPELETVSKNAELLVKAIGPFLARKEAAIINFLASASLGLEQLRYAQGQYALLRDLGAFINGAGKNLMDAFTEAKRIQEEIRQAKA